MSIKSDQDLLASKSSLLVQKVANKGCLWAISFPLMIRALSEQSQGMDVHITITKKIKNSIRILTHPNNSTCEGRKAIKASKLTMVN